MSGRECLKKPITGIAKIPFFQGVYASLSHQWEESQYKVKHQGRLHYTTWSRLLPILLNERFGPPLVALLERNGFVALD